ncbi:HIT family protein [Ferrimicrobium sp.]|uniref:HIT family protein n=1 Tax=Ferrimicrobium sp. TaxID=2926050 RepID=UPI00262C8D22|nr:HIT family protein [Ferrimicrobium sp.]
MNCPFCDLIKDPENPLVVESAAQTSVLLDHAPVFLGHALVIPTEHVEHLLVASSETVASITLTTQAVAKASIAAFGADGALTVTNTIVSQSVPHLHVHVIPRRYKDGLRGFLWPRQRYASDGELLEYRDRLREALRDYSGPQRTKQ